MHNVWLKEGTHVNCGYYYCDSSEIFPIISTEAIITNVGNHKVG